MIISRKQTATVPAIWLHASIAALSGFLLRGPLKHRIVRRIRHFDMAACHF
jgi:hypothetical protein